MRIVSPNFADLLDPNIEIKRFPDGEAYVRIPELEKYRNEDTLVFHRLYPSPNESIVELLLILRTLQSVGARSTLVAPYFIYARQDKLHHPGEALSAGIISELLVYLGCLRLVTFDCHFLTSIGTHNYHGLSIDNRSMAPSLAGKVKSMFEDEFIIISPDQGAAYMAEAHGGQALKKTRGDYGDHIEAYRHIASMEGDLEVQGRSVLVLDDIIQTGSTMIKAAQFARSRGAKRVVCAATHGLFLKDSEQKLKEVSDFLLVTDSVPSPQSQVSIRSQILDLTKLS